MVAFFYFLRKKIGQIELRYFPSERRISYRETFLESNNVTCGKEHYFIVRENSGKYLSLFISDNKCKTKIVLSIRIKYEGKRSWLCLKLLAQFVVHCTIINTDSSIFKQQNNNFFTKTQ